jgi:GPH family glycoside/pentoside/hexuronide:cation symporter
MGSISLKEKIGYGFGDMASSMFWKLFSMYLLFFYTDVMGINAAAVGTLFLITRIWDTAFDPIVGIIADRTNTRWGKFRPFLLFMAFPFGIIAVLTFTVPGFSSTARLLYAYFTYSAMMMIYSLINVPYASLLGVISPDPKQRNILASFRMTFAFLGSLIALALIEPLISFWGGSTHEIVTGNAAAWQKSIGIIALVCVLLFILCFSWVKERVLPFRAAHQTLRTDLFDLLANRPLWILMFSGMATLIFNSVRDGSAIFYFRYYIAENEALDIGVTMITFSTLYFVVGQIGNIIGVIIASPLANRYGKKSTYAMSMLFAFILSILFFWIDNQALLPLFLLQFLISTSAGIVFPLLWSMYADLADYSEWKTGRRITGLLFSYSSMSQKFGWTIGGALTGWLLAAFGFQAHIQQSEYTLFGLRLLLSWLPASGAALSLLLILLYPLTDKQLIKITAELNDKRLLNNPA